MEPTIIESCHSTFVFDTDRMRFRRILKGIEVSQRPVATGWRPYWDLESPPGAETFTIALNAERTRLIRSWHHTPDCVQCGGHDTAQLSLEDLRAALLV
jgi:hypothetical protein